MSDQELPEEAADARRPEIGDAGREAALLGGGRGGSGGRRAFGVTFALAALAIAAFMAFPDQIRHLIFGRTSEVEEMQRVSTTGDGVSTAMTSDRDAGPGVEVDPTAIQTPEHASSGVAETPDPDADRIAALERRIEELSVADGLDEERMRAMLDEQAERLRAENERALEAQRRALLDRAAPSQAGFTPAVGPTSLDREAEAARQRAEEERSRRLAIYNEQVASDGLVYDGSAAGGGVIGGSSGPGVSRRLNGDERFLASAAASGVETVEATALTDPSRTIIQGTVIEATLETAIDTDLPGLIRAVTSHPVWSYDGENILLPAGSRLIGQYSSDIKLLQSRALIAWTRAVTPDGVSVNLGSVGADALGRSGQTGDVDSHFGAKFGTAALISILGAAPVAITGDASTDTVGGDLAADIGDDLRGATSSVLQDYLRVPPTIRIDQGTVMTVFVNRDLIF